MLINQDIPLSVRGSAALAKRAVSHGDQESPGRAEGYRTADNGRATEPAKQAPRRPGTCGSAQPNGGPGTAEAGIVRAKAGQAPLRRSRLRISYSCTIA